MGKKLGEYKHGIILKNSKKEEQLLKGSRTKQFSVKTLSQGTLPIHYPCVRATLVLAKNDVATSFNDKFDNFSAVGGLLINHPPSLKNAHMLTWVLSLWQL
ncbi:unnamed protein product [Mucor hiemalis]